MWPSGSGGGRGRDGVLHGAGEAHGGSGSQRQRHHRQWRCALQPDRRRKDERWRVGTRETRLYLLVISVYIQKLFKPKISHCNAFRTAWHPRYSKGEFHLAMNGCVKPSCKLDRGLASESFRSRRDGDNKFRLQRQHAEQPDSDWNDLNNNATLTLVKQDL